MPEPDAVLLGRAQRRVLWKELEDGLVETGDEAAIEGDANQ
jgi:hypothetical protein